MSPESPYPKSIERPEESRITQVLGQVQRDGCSRALLLYGAGGVGKTSLVRRMMVQASVNRGIEWLDPIDVDDSRYWMLSNLEDQITKSLDAPGSHFDLYKEQLSQLSHYTRRNISRETVASYLGRLKETFAQCYSNYVADEEKTVVIVFDTVETIRDTNLRSNLAQWMKDLPRSTLFILAGRPVVDEDANDQDPIEEELDNPHYGIELTKVEMGSFILSDSHSYVAGSDVSDALVADDMAKLALLTRGQPLWLAFVIDYLIENGIPEEAQHSLEYVEEHLPYDREMTAEGKRLRESFLRRLVAPYRRSDFWHEATKRLAVVRQPIELVVWRRLMSDLSLPEGTADLDAAWHELIRLPWIRSRANDRYVTLHDAVAEAFAQRLFPLHDPDHEWRRRIWQKALDIYTDLARDKEAALTAANPELASGISGQDSGTGTGDLAVDTPKREVDELKALRLYYLFLTDFEAGCRQLLKYFEQASKEHDPFIQDLLILYLQRFLPGSTSSGVFDDVIKAKVDDFRDWLTTRRQDLYVEIGVMAADYFIQVAQPETALRLLDQLPEEFAEPRTRYRLHILKGNASMRIAREPNASQATEGAVHFDRALEVARELPGEDRAKLIAEAYKELGFYFRNIGDWKSANDSYRTAQAELMKTPAGSSSGIDLNEIASIETNWAYVMGLDGNYTEGIQLADRAIELRHQYGSPVEEGISWSVCGEIYRYAKRFDKAWEAYAAAERLLQGPNWNWLGLIYQEQAICLYQAWRENDELTEQPMAEAKRLITSALDICLSRNIRAYPSALNRAGRIFGHDDPLEGLRYLEKGIEEARRLSDGWFLLANLVEYAELSYRAWIETDDNQYRSRISEQAPTINDVLNSGAPGDRFPDLAGRWEILQGHLALGDYRSNHSAEALDKALEHYKTGFLAIAERSLASSGAALIPGEFEKFERHFRVLPADTREDWQTKLMAAWQGPGDGSALLLARLQELLARLLREEAPTIGPA